MKSNRLPWALILILVALVGLAVSLRHVTADEATTKFRFPTAVCSMPLVFQNYVHTQDMLSRLNALNSELQAEQTSRSNAIKERMEELKALVRGSEAHMKLAESIENQEIELRIWQETQQARLRREHGQITERMYEAITKVASEIAVENGIQVVLNRTEMDLTNNPAQQLVQPHVLYASEATDITAEVIRRLNEQYTSQQQPSQ